MEPGFFASAAAKMDQGAGIIQREGKRFEISDLWRGRHRQHFCRKLSKAGYDVTVLARGKRFEELKEKGILLKGAYLDQRERCPVKVIYRLEADDLYDYVLVVLQKTQVDAVLPDLSANKSPNFVLWQTPASGMTAGQRLLGQGGSCWDFPRRAERAETES